MAFKKTSLSPNRVPPRPNEAAATQATASNRDEEDYNTQVASPDQLVDGVIAHTKEFNTLEPGRYEAILNEVVAMEPKDTGLFIRAEFIIADPDPALMGRKHSVPFQMLQEDLRTPGQWGPSFYHQMMAKLGYPQDNRGEDARAEITEQKPGVYLKIAAGKREGFVNTSVEGRFDEDNENIEALREWLSNNPY